MQAAQDCLEQPPGPEPHRIVRRARSRPPRRRSPAARPRSSRVRVFSAIAATFAGRAGSAIALVQLDQLGQRQQRVARDSPRSRSSRPGGRARTRAAPSRGSARASRRSTPGGGARPGPRPRAARPPRACALDDELLGAPAMKSETTASTAIPQPAIAIPVCPVGTKTDSSPRRCASRSSSSETVIFPIAQSEPTVRTIRAGTSRFSPVGTFSPAGGLRRSRSSTPCSAASSTSSGSSVRNSCSPFSTSRPAAIALPQQLAPRRREAAALRSRRRRARSSARTQARPRPCRRSGSPRSSPPPAPSRGSRPTGSAP